MLNPFKFFARMLTRRVMRTLNPHHATPITEFDNVSEPIHNRLDDFAAEFQQASLHHLGDIVVWRFAQFVQSVWTTPERDLFVIGIAQLEGPIESAAANHTWVEASTLILNDNQIGGIITKRPNDEESSLQHQVNTSTHDPNAFPADDLEPQSSIDELIFSHREKVQSLADQALRVDDRTWLATIREIESHVLGDFSQ